MSVPKFHEFFAPVVRILYTENAVLAVRQIREKCYQFLDLSEDDRNQLLPSGRGRTVDNRVNWALVYLKNAGLIQAPNRGKYIITSLGRKAYESQVPLTLDYLNQFESFQAFYSGGNPSLVQQQEIVDHTEMQDTPTDVIDNAFEQIRKQLADELLSAIMEQTPAFFERLVVDLLLKMGYGGSFDEAGLVVGQSGDEGIDGIIREDKLGFSSICIQAKRWDPTSKVGRPEIMKFVGALSGQGASKGLFITTAQFSEEAKKYVNKHLAAKIVLVDGEKLTRLMIENNVGVSTHCTYTIKKIDSDFFSQE